MTKKKVQTKDIITKKNDKNSNDNNSTNNEKNNNKDDVDKTINKDNNENNFKSNIKCKLNDKYKLVKKYVKVNQKPITILSISIIAFFTIWFLFNFSIEIYTYSSPIVSVEPEHKYIEMLNIDQRNIEFEIETKTNILCEVECNYNLIDRSQNIIVDKGSFDSNGIKKINTTISSPGKGIGEKVFNFELICKNKNSNLCLNTDTITTKSSIIILSYDLTNEEKDIKETYREPILKFLTNLNEIDKSIKISDFNLNNNREYFNNYNNSIKINDYRIENDVIKIYGNLSLKLWKNEDYIKLTTKNLGEYFKLSDELKSKLNSEQDKIKSNIKIQGKSASKFNKLVYDYISEIEDKNTILENLIYIFKSEIRIDDENVADIISPNLFEKEKYLFEKYNELNYDIKKIKNKYNNENNKYNNNLKFNNDILNLEINLDEFKIILK